MDNFFYLPCVPKQMCALKWILIIIILTSWALFKGTSSCWKLWAIKNRNFSCYPCNPFNIHALATNNFTRRRKIIWLAQSEISSISSHDSNEAGTTYESIKYIHLLKKLGIWGLAYMIRKKSLYTYLSLLRRIRTTSSISVSLESRWWLTGKIEGHQINSLLLIWKVREAIGGEDTGRGDKRRLYSRIC